MVLSIWYSYNHRCFKTRIGYLPWNAKIGYTNGFGEELLAIYPLYRDKQTIKGCIIHFLKKNINRLESPKKKGRVIYITKYKRRWWR